MKHPIKKTARKKLAAVEERERENNKYQLACQDIGAEFVPLVIESYGGYGPQFNVFVADLRIIAQNNLTLTDGESIINDMLNQIALHVISLNGMIMKAAIASQEA